MVRVNLEDRKIDFDLAGEAAGKDPVRKKRKGKKGKKGKFQTRRK